MSNTLPAQTAPANTRSGLAGRGTPKWKWWHGWVPLLVLPWIVFLLFPDTWPRWALMWTLAFVLFCGCKWLTWRRTDVREVPLWRHVSYLVGWPGLDAKAFLTGPPPARPAPREWLFALGKLALGVCLLFGVTRWVPVHYPYLLGWVGMVGIIMILHFGTFHLISCAWRSVSVEARPLMNWPLDSKSVSEFWGRRWNTAFRDLTHRFLFRSLVPRLGPRAAIFVGFVFSGLVHDVVISVPARGGYGGPTLFFLVQGTAILVERSQFGQRIGLGQDGRGWLFTMLVLIIPVYFLFHPPFVLAIVVPFLQALGAIG